MADKQVKYLIRKTVSTLKDEGIKIFVKRTGDYLKFNVFTRMEPTYHDVLFINGCTLPHPKRYRVDHQIEQLAAYGLSADTIDYDKLTIDVLKYFRCFVFYRCPITPTVEELILLAKKNNKIVFYDIDDLVIDEKYTNTIKHLKTLSKEEKDMYDDGVIRMQKTLRMCDYAITTTEKLAEELENYCPEVYVNRNVASEKMVQYSLMATDNVKKENDKIVLGYLSGSITHNVDFEMILPAVVKIMKKYSNVYLKVIGELDVPNELEPFKDRLITSPFVDWMTLPEIIASLDINLAPLEDTIFNEAKSENKWVEAALCKVVTVASNMGAFKQMIVDYETGVLCVNTVESWYDALELLINNDKLRNEIAKNAFNYCIKKKVTTYTGRGLAEYIESKLARNIAFVLPTTNISGGVNVVLKHISILKKHGYDVFVINNDVVNDDIVNNDGIVYVLSYQKVKFAARIDTMVATLWDTLKLPLKYYNVKNIKYIVQNFETDFMPYGQYAKSLANRTYSTYKDIEYITISKWCKDWLYEDYGKNSTYAPNGINLKQFPYKERSFKEKKIKILIEGNSKDYYKNVDESFRIVEKLDKNRFEIHFLSYQGEPKKWYYVDKFMHKIPYDDVGKVYQDADILLKSSLLESFSYPPLEMMATGGLVVAVPNGGNVEYLKDGINCLFYEQGCIDDAVDKIELLINNDELRNKLLKNGKETAELRNWDSIEQDILELYNIHKQ
ncbi:glycosyltransferase [Thomasclavelia ramosa]|uniref:glycosyltransferase n=1 Tax=Thomasclavelia ramosa TaxID=1547 RepID=UPI00191D7518|nr:glycosyltransferase [Thomasclavelia ramosa]MCR1957764.1 glycosyltransferase [Thomasclavelia ramosa]QQV05331.1 glycosyltransferase [Thomasclavelia ramosa]